MLNSQKKICKNDITTCVNWMKSSCYIHVTLKRRLPYRVGDMETKLSFVSIQRTRQQTWGSVLDGPHTVFADIVCCGYARLVPATLLVEIASPWALHEDYLHCPFIVGLLHLFHEKTI